VLPPVTGGFFSTLRIRPFLGRDFHGAMESDLRSTVILTYPCWQRFFGPATDLSDRSIQVESDVHPIIGVLPPGFAFEYLWNVDVFARVDFPPSMVGDRVTRGLRTIGRSRRFLPRKPHDAR